MIAVGWILKYLPENPPSNIVEFGVGWGHVSRILAHSGYSVSSVDIEKDFLNLLVDPKFGSNQIDIINDSFEKVIFPENSLSAAIFFECFHHSLEHALVIKNLANALKSGGKIIFAAEPFYDDWFDYPWGIRLDGHAVWAIRSFGWLELGFRKTYIDSLLNANNFALDYHSVGEIGAYGNFLVATKI
jgi:SAM-dependent methyltransferase